MKLSQATTLISEFVSRGDPSRTFDSLSEHDYREILDVIASRLPFSGGRIERDAPAFLYAACLNFDRWVAPTPYVLLGNEDVDLSDFLTALETFPGARDSAPRFHLDLLKSEMFRLLHCQPVIEANNAVAQLHRSVVAIKPPAGRADKRKEFDDLRDELSTLVDAVQNHSLQTHIRTSIPFSPVLRPTRLQTTWRNIPTEVSFVPRFQEPPNQMFATPDATAIPLQASQWQHSLSEVDIVIHALIDHAVPGPPLATTTVDGPFDRWPDVFRLCFELLNALIWTLRDEVDLGGRWILRPTDIGTLQWRLRADAQEVGFVAKGPPGVIVVAASAANETDFEERTLSLKDIPWHSRCEKVAENLLSSGQPNDATFWLNVAVESLFGARLQSICEESGQGGLLEAVNSSKSYWERAKELLKEQVPGVAERVEWPHAAEYSPSWYARIRYLGKRVVLKARTNDLLSSYSRIHKHRNDLFHGSFAGSPSAQDAEDALKAFKYLEEHFVLDD